MIIFVGDKPSKRMKPGAKPFEGAACEKRFMDWIRTIGVWPFYIVNKDDMVMAVMFAACKAPVIALGRDASKALKGIPHFKLPHPSGRNRQINNKTFIQEKLQECREWLRLKV